MKKATLIMITALILSSEGVWSLTNKSVINGAEKLQKISECAISKDINENALPGEVLCNPEAEYDAIIEVQDESTLTALKKAGVKVGTYVDGLATVKIPLSAIAQLSAIKGIGDVSLSHEVIPQLDKAREATNIDKIHAGIGENQTAYTGKGVIVGVVDNGFQLDHASFVDPESNELRISRLWDQRKDTTVHPAKFSYGFEYTDKDSIKALKSEYIYSSHGTHVLGIAAGGDTRKSNPYYGAAKDAEIVLVGCGGTLGNVVDGVKYIFDYADSVQKPCVINLSLGAMLGPHDGTSSTDRMLDALQGPGRIIVGAAGNYGGTTHHVGHDFSFRNPTLRTALSFNSYSTVKYTLCELWGTSGKKYQVKVSLYDQTYGEEVYSTDYIEISNDAVLTINEKLLPQAATDSIEMSLGIITGVSQYNSKPNAYIQLGAKGIDRKRFFTCLEVKGTGGTIDGWADGSQSTFTRMNNPEYEAGDDKYSIAELGGTGKQIISVGSYCTRSSLSYLSGSSKDYSYTIGNIVASSSVGPTPDGRVKPEIAAPGQIIVSAYNSSYYSFDSQSMMDFTYLNNKYYYYGAMSGTSMSSPLVAGIIATWLEADPKLTPDQAREAIKLSAINDEYTGDLKTNASTQWGYGKVDAYNGLLKVIAGTSGVENVDIDENSNATVEYYNLNGIKVNALNDVTPGIYIRRQGTSVSKILIK
jgi:subtilisin family serine protease